MASRIRDKFYKLLGEAVKKTADPATVTLKQINAQAANLEATGDHFVRGAHTERLLAEEALAAGKNKPPSRSI